MRQARAGGHQVLATARGETGLARLTALGATARCRWMRRRRPSCAGLARSIDGEAFDQAWLVAGVYGPKTSGLEAPAESEFDTVMHTNVLAAMRLLPIPRRAPGAGRRLAGVFAHGSIGARSSHRRLAVPGLPKAALNSVLKDASLALAGRAVCVALHPGGAHRHGRHRRRLAGGAHVADSARRGWADAGMSSQLLNHDGQVTRGEGRQRPGSSRRRMGRRARRR